MLDKSFILHLSDKSKYIQLQKFISKNEPLKNKLFLNTPQEDMIVFMGTINIAVLIEMALILREKELNENIQYSIEDYISCASISGFGKLLNRLEAKLKDNTLKHGDLFLIFSKSYHDFLPIMPICFGERVLIFEQEITFRFFMIEIIKKAFITDMKDSQLIFEMILY